MTKWLRLKGRNPQIKIELLEEVPTDPKGKGNTYHESLEMTVMTQDLTKIEETSSTLSVMKYLLLQQSLHPKIKETWNCGANITRNTDTHSQIAANERGSLTSMLMKGNSNVFSTMVHQEGDIIRTNESTERRSQKRNPRQNITPAQPME